MALGAVKEKIGWKQEPYGDWILVSGVLIGTVLIKGKPRHS